MFYWGDAERRRMKKGVGREGERGAMVLLSMHFKTPHNFHIPIVFVGLLHISLMAFYLVGVGHC